MIICLMWVLRDKFYKTSYSQDKFFSCKLEFFFFFLEIWVLYLTNFKACILLRTLLLEKLFISSYVRMFW